MSRLPGKRARPVLRGPGCGNAPRLPDWKTWFYLLEAAGLDVQLVNARDVKNVPGRPKTDKLDAVWLAKLTEKGLLRPSFVPPRPIRVLRDYTRLRVDLTAERVRYWARLEKLLEDALIKVSAVASRIDTVSVRDMIEALIAGERSPRVLADLARARMRLKHADLVQALTGQFDDHHAELARMLLDADRRTHRADRHAHRPHRRAAGRNARTARPGRPRTWRRHHGAQRAAIGGARRPGQPRPERTHPATDGAIGGRGDRHPRRDPRHRPTRRPGDHRRAR